jgi:hypothetical protein
MALQAWMIISHPTLPDIVLAPEGLRSVVASILSLRERR